MLRKVAASLLNCVYYPITAVAVLDAQENVLEVRLFDTVFCVDADYSFAADAPLVAVVFNHPEGRMTITEEEMVKLAQIRAALPQAQVKAYLSGEDIGFFAAQEE